MFFPLSGEVNSLLQTIRYRKKIFSFVFRFASAAFDANRHAGDQNVP
jgi:hypothetical protein